NLADRHPIALKCNQVVSSSTPANEPENPPPQKKAKKKVTGANTGIIIRENRIVAESSSEESDNILISAPQVRSQIPISPEVACSDSFPPPSNMDKSSFDLTGVEVEIDLSSFNDVFMENNVVLNDPLTDMVSLQPNSASLINDIPPPSSSKEQATKAIKETTVLPEESRKRKSSYSENEILPPTSTSALGHQNLASSSDPTDKSAEAQGQGNPVNCKFDDSLNVGVTSKPAPPRSTMPMSSSAPLFIPALSVHGRNVTVADSAWRDPAIAFAMTQKTTLPRDEQSLKGFSNKSLKSHQFCLLAELKDVCGEIIFRDYSREAEINKKDEAIHRLKQRRDELVKEKDRLKFVIDNNDVVSKLKRDYHKLKTETAEQQKIHEGQVNEMKAKILQAEYRAKHSEEAKLFMAVKVSEVEAKLDAANLEIKRLTTNLQSAENKITSVEAENIRITADLQRQQEAHISTVHEMQEKLDQLEAAITEKDKACTIWYKEMTEKSKVAVAEEVAKRFSEYVNKLPRKVVVPPPSPPPPSS
ncbi:hypothetical protein FRX31_009819, partial [Thalictrum thalictroides]